MRNGDEEEDGNVDAEVEGSEGYEGLKKTLLIPFLGIFAQLELLLPVRYLCEERKRQPFFVSLWVWEDRRRRKAIYRLDSRESKIVDLERVTFIHCAVA